MTFSELNIGSRTYRRFKQDPMPEELMRSMLENARISNCATNSQNLKFIGVYSKEYVEKMHSLVKYAAALPPEIGMPKEGETPVAFVVIVKGPKSNAWTDIDVGIAARNITATAWEAGFGSCLLGNINVPKIAELLEVPEDETVRLVVALGKPDHTSTIVEIPESGKTAYYVDDDRNYYVPKRSFEDVVKIF